MPTFSDGFLNESCITCSWPVTARRWTRRLQSEPSNFPQPHTTSGMTELEHHFSRMFSMCLWSRMRALHRGATRHHNRKGNKRGVYDSCLCMLAMRLNVISSGLLHKHILGRIFYLLTSDSEHVHSTLGRHAHSAPRRVRDTRSDGGAVDDTSSSAGTARQRGVTKRDWRVEIESAQEKAIETRLHRVR